VGVLPEMKGQRKARPRQARLDAPGTLFPVMVRGIEKHRMVDDRLADATLVVLVKSQKIRKIFKLDPNDFKIY
jgi:hypothetical protein